MDRLVFAAAATVLVFVLVPRRRASRALHLVRDAVGNEALVVEGVLVGTPSLFLVDTAYAGAPVVSMSYLAAGSNAFDPGSVETRYRRAMHALRHEVTEDARHAALRGLLAQGACRSYTSGCTMRLMGIGTTNEAQADMLLCPPVLPGSHAHVDADVLVTHPLHGSVHILTCDFLLHRAPAVLRPRAGTLELGVHDPLRRHGFEMHPARFVGGAFVVAMTVGDAPLQIVVDTGAAAALSLGASAARKLRTCAATARRATQTGVHREKVCSDVLTARVRVGSLDVGEVEVFATAGEVQGADGYAGMGLLRSVDLWLQPDAIGFRRSGLAPRRSEATRAGRCDGAQSKLPTCAHK